MEKYLLESEQLKKVLEKAIDLFQDYQYNRGYEEPLARTKAVTDILTSLRNIKGAGTAPGS
ncbi:MAG: hypothetical protein AB9866_01760 [Syntrophobacteraceae bacterium]